MNPAIPRTAVYAPLALIAATRSTIERDLIIHGSAHRGANGVAMPTDEDDQDGHFFYNHPERGAYSAA